MLDIESFGLVGTDGGSKHPEDPSNDFLKILKRGSISIEKHELENLEILNMRSILYEQTSNEV